MLSRLLVVVLTFLIMSPAFAQEEPVGAQEKVFVIPFTGEVELGLVKVFQHGYFQAKQQDADRILVEVDTPGGRVDAALEIIDIIMGSDIPTTMLVTGDATSAGAIISIAAEQIYMMEGTTIGTAAPVMVGGAPDEAMNAKILSYMLTKVRSICEERGFDEKKTKLFEAMVDKDIEIEDPDEPGKFITETGKLLGLTSNEALDVGLIAGVVKDRQGLLETMGLDGAEIVAYEPSGFERLARWLSSMSVSGVLITVAVIGLIWEFRTPGIGLPALVGGTALALFFWGHLLAGLTGYESIVLFLLGITMIGLELFVIPGFGLTGLVGFASIFAAIVLTLLDRPITSPHFTGTFDWGMLYGAVALTMASMLVGGFVAMLLPFLFPAAAQTRIGSWLLLQDTQDRSKGYHSAEEGLDMFLGKIGLAKTPLRPAGIASIEGKRLDVVSQGGFIPPNTTVEVVRVEGRRVVVKKA